MALSTGEKALIAIAAVGGLVLVAKAASSAAPQNISNKPIQATSYVTGNPVPNILAEQPGAIGKTWEGILSAAAGSSGVSEGVAKILTVTSISPTSTTIIS